MKKYHNEQHISQLEKRKGGYFFLKIDSEVVDQLSNARHTRLICRLDKKISFQCGLNHLGDGNYFIILSGKNLESVGKKVGDNLKFEIWEDPNPLGVDMPEVLVNLLEQDAVLNQKFLQLTLGKKRSIIHQMKNIKNFDKQVHKSIELINNADKPRSKRDL